MSDPSTLAARVGRLEDRAAIADLVHGYAQTMRRGECDKGVAMFTPDGLFTNARTAPGAPTEVTETIVMNGHAEILDHLVNSVGRISVWPVIHNLIIEVDGDQATGSSVMIASVLGSPHKMMGEYKDRYVKRDGGWLFAERHFTMVS